MQEVCKRFGAREVARTIADVEGEERVNGNHIAEALQYRGEEDEG